MQLFTIYIKLYPFAYRFGHKNNEIRKYYIVSSSWQEHEFVFLGFSPPVYMSV